MENKIPGWYAQTRTSEADPALLRYWDGYQWTEHTMPVPVDRSPGAVAAAYGSVYGTTSGAPGNPGAPVDRGAALPASAYGPQPGPHQAGDPAYPGAYGPYGGPGAARTVGPARTPDGQLLAGWWHRVGAFVIDSVITSIVLVAVAFPLFGRLIDSYRDAFDQALDASRSGSRQPAPFSLQGDVVGTVALIALVGVAISFVYQVGFLSWKQATPGMLLTGLRVRRRDVPGPLPLGTVLLRWLVEFGPGALRAVPLVGGLASLYSLLNYLWPLWDPQKQALHDKAAGTNVVLQQRG